MQALNYYVILKEHEDKEEVGEAGIIINTGLTKTNLVKANVVSVGSESMYVNGDSSVYVLRSLCKEMPIEGTTFLVTKSENLLATI